jgi:hypothetical protein
MEFVGRNLIVELQRERGNDDGQTVLHVEMVNHSSCHGQVEDENFMDTRSWLWCVFMDDEPSWQNSIDSAMCQLRFGKLLLRDRFMDW